MSEITLDTIERGMKATCGTVLRNEIYFCELDALARRRRLRQLLGRGLPRDRGRPADARQEHHQRLAAEDQHDHLQAHRRLLGSAVGHALHARRHDRQGQERG
ncbi:MAG: hypothetical protein WDN45_01860 [Caulobacteraceae bacterium]